MISGASHSPTPAPVLRYPGAKWSIAPRIVELLPAHRVYLEPFFGSGAVLFSKPPSPVEIINDSDGEVANLFRVLRDGDARVRLIEAVELTPWSEEELRDTWEPADVPDGVESARMLLVRAWFNVGVRQLGTPHFRFAGPGPGSGDLPPRVWSRLPERIAVAGERLAGVQVLDRDAVGVIRAHAAKDVLVYADPPYPVGVLSTTRPLYRRKVDHLKLLQALKAHPGPVVVSGYACELYDTALADWTRVELAGRGQRSAAKVEVLWLNPAAMRAARRFAPTRLPGAW